MSISPDMERRRVEFFALSDFGRFVYPMLDERKSDLLRKLVDKGGEEYRFRIKEIEMLEDIFRNVGTKESATNL